MQLRRCRLARSGLRMAPQVWTPSVEEVSYSHMQLFTEDANRIVSTLDSWV